MVSIPVILLIWLNLQFCDSLPEITSESGTPFAEFKTPFVLICTHEEGTMEWIAEFATIAECPNGITTDQFTYKVKVTCTNTTSSKLEITTVKKPADTYIQCKSRGNTTGYTVLPLSKNKGQLYPESGSQNVLVNSTYKLVCDHSGGDTSWYDGKGRLIGRYSDTCVNNKAGESENSYVNRVKITCENNKRIILEINNVELKDEDTGIACFTNVHNSLITFNVFVPVKNVTVREYNNAIIPIEKKRKVYECNINGSKPEPVVHWYITRAQKRTNITENIITTSNLQTSGKLFDTISRVNLSLTKYDINVICAANINFKGVSLMESNPLKMDVRYAPENKPNITVSKDGVCIGKSTMVTCNWNGGYPSAKVKLIYGKSSHTGSSTVQINVTISTINETCHCEGIHIARNVSSGENELNVFYPPKSIEIKNYIPFLEGKPANITCEGKGGNPHNYTYNWSPDENFSKMDRKQNNKNYTCSAFNICNKNNPISTRLQLNVEYLPSISTKETVTVLENKTVTLTCTAKGNPTPQVIWKYGKDNSSSNILTTAFTRHNASNISCIATGKSTKYGELTNTTSVTVIVEYPPRVSINITNGKLGDDVTIQCTANNGYPVNYKYILLQKWGDVIKKTVNEKQKILQNVSFGDMGTWYCQVSNGVPDNDFNVSDSAELKIKTKPVLEANERVKNVSNGAKVEFKGCYYSYPSPYEIKWQKNEAKIPQEKYSNVAKEPGHFPFDGNCSVFKLDNVQDKDVGNYTMSVKNSEGEATITFSLWNNALVPPSGQTSSPNTGIIAGSVIGVLLFIVIIAGIFFYKLRYTKDKNSIKNNLLNVNTPQEPTMIVNDIYESSDDVLSNQPVEESLYAQVDKSKKNTDPITVEDGLYAQVDISKKKAPKETNAQVDKPKKKLTPKPVEESLYAQVDKSKKNTDPITVEDGLYAQVDILKKKAPKETNAQVDKPKKRLTPKPVDEELYAEVDKSKKKPSPKNFEESLYPQVDKSKKDIPSITVEDGLYAQVDISKKKAPKETNAQVDKPKKKLTPKPVDEELYAEVDKKKPPPKKYGKEECADIVKSKKKMPPKQDKIPNVENKNLSEDLYETVDIKKETPVAQDELLYADLDFVKESASKPKLKPKPVKVNLPDEETIYASIDHTK